MALGSILYQLYASYMLLLPYCPLEFCGFRMRPGRGGVLPNSYGRVIKFSIHRKSIVECVRMPTLYWNQWHHLLNSDTHILPPKLICNLNDGEVFFIIPSDFFLLGISLEMTEFSLCIVIDFVHHFDTPAFLYGAPAKGQFSIISSKRVTLARLKLNFPTCCFLQPLHHRDNVPPSYHVLQSMLAVPFLTPYCCSLWSKRVWDWTLSNESAQAFSKK